MSKAIQSIGIIGYGAFGKVWADLCRKAFPQAQICVYSPHSIVPDLFVSSSLNEIAQCDIVFPCVPIRNFEQVIRKCVSFFHSDSIVVSICSVMTYPQKILSDVLPQHISYVVMHPLFGPRTFAKQKTFDGLQIVYDPVTINPHIRGIFKEIELLGIRMSELASDVHDAQAAHGQFLAHLCARGLAAADFHSTHLDSSSVQLLSEAVNLTGYSEDTLFEDMYRFNPHCANVYEQFCKGLHIN